MQPDSTQASAAPNPVGGALTELEAHFAELCADMRSAAAEPRRRGEYLRFVAGLARLLDDHAYGEMAAIFLPRSKPEADDGE